MASVVLIRPPSLTAKWNPSVIATPPLAHAYLAGTLTRHRHSVTIIDAVGEAYDKKTEIDANFSAYGLTHEEIIERIPENTNLIGISSMFTMEWPAVRLLAHAIRARFPSIPLVCGGEHISAEPEFSMKDCSALDFCVIGEGEETLLELVQAIESRTSHERISGIAYVKDGKFVKTPARARKAELDQIPWPRWDLTPIRNYLDYGLSFGVRRGRSMPMLATRGCPYACTFCSSAQMWTTKWLARDPHEVVREIRYYVDTYEISNIDFYDLTLIIRKDWIVQFAKLLIEANLNITWQLPSSTRSETIDDEICKLLYLSGCRNVGFAPESGSPAVLKRIKKRVDLDHLLSAMKSAYRCGINTKFNLIFGFPAETHREIFESFRFIVHAAWVGVHDMSIWLFSPYPGSEIFGEFRRSGQITFDDQYFVNISAYSDFSSIVSWNPKMNGATLRFYRLFGTALFYAVSYASRPLRAFRLIRNLASGQHESRLETVLVASWQRINNSAFRN